MDLASIEAGLLPLARLVIADAHEMTYSVTAEGAIQVPRFNAVDKYVCVRVVVVRLYTPESTSRLYVNLQLPSPKPTHHHNNPHRVAARSERVLASDKAVSFFADVEKQVTMGKIGAKFRLQHVPAPKDDEVQVDVYAAALNFRDVMIALSLLPEKSYEASFYGKNLGLEASGVVTAVGKDVTNLKVRVACISHARAALLTPPTPTHVLKNGI